MLFVTPRPERVYGTCNYRGAYEHQVSHCNILGVVVHDEIVK